MNTSHFIFVNTANLFLAVKKYVQGIFLNVTVLLILLLFLSPIAIAYPASNDSTTVDHSLFTAVLKDHVNGDRVDYAAIKSDPRFTEYIEILQNTDPDLIPQKDRLAFWVNVYNAFTIKVVVDQYPIKSIMSKFKYALKKSNFHKKYVIINGVEYSLNDVENDIIRPFGDARIHFALVCAAKSCPPLRTEAYDPDKLDEQFDEQGRIFLSQPSKNSFDFEKKEAKISKIFDWFEEDFLKNAPTVLDFISRYLPEEQSKMLLANANEMKIKHSNYNWDLNE